MSVAGVGRPALLAGVLVAIAMWSLGTVHAREQQPSAESLDYASPL